MPPCLAYRFSRLSTFVRSAAPQLESVAQLHSKLDEIISLLKHQTGEPVAAAPALPTAADRELSAFVNQQLQRRTSSRAQAQAPPGTAPAIDVDVVNNLASTSQVASSSGPPPVRTSRRRGRAAQPDAPATSGPAAKASRPGSNSRRLDLDEISESGDDPVVTTAE